LHRDDWGEVLAVNNQRPEQWIVRGIPAAGLLVSAPAVIVLGFFEMIWGLGLVATSGLRLGSDTDTGTVALGLALIIVGFALVWLARGVWRGRPWPTHLAVAFTVAAMWFCASFVPRDVGGELIALAIIPYAIMLACLVVLEIRQQRPAHQN
jgi:hypothetical protein